MPYVRSGRVFAAVLLSFGLSMPGAGMDQSVRADPVPIRSDDRQARERIDRRIVSPFDTTRRIVVSPSDHASDHGDTPHGSKPAAVPVPASAADLAPAAAPAPEFVHIGSIDLPLVPPAQVGTYENIGTYPASSFSPD